MGLISWIDCITCTLLSRQALSCDCLQSYHSRTGSNSPDAWWPAQCRVTDAHSKQRFRAAGRHSTNAGCVECFWVTTYSMCFQHSSCHARLRTGLMVRQEAGCSMERGRSMVICCRYVCCRLNLFLLSMQRKILKAMSIVKKQCPYKKK